MKKIMLLILTAILFVNVASAVVVTNVQAPTFEPGQENTVKIEVENILNDDVQDISINLDFTGSEFIPVTSSSDGFDDLESGDDGTFTFRIKASNDIEPGNYRIPYTITYFLEDTNEQRTRDGTIGIKVTGDVELTFSVDTETPVLGRDGTISLKMVNKGFADAKFLSVKVLPNGYVLKSESELYIGTIDSDDFETAEFDVIFTTQKPTLSAVIEYKDFNNNQLIKNIEVPITVYTPEKAIELGIIERNNTPYYVGIVVVLIILWILYRTIKKRRKLKRSQRR